MARHPVAMTVSSIARRRMIAGSLWFSGGLSVLAIIAWVLWANLPTWKPHWVIRHSPFVDPVFRADGGPGLIEGGYDPFGDLYSARIKAWGASITPQIKAGLSSADERVRRAAMVACNILSTEGDIQRDAELGTLLVELLEDDLPGMRRSSALCLGLLKEPSAVEPLIDHLSNEMRTDVAIAMCRALGRLGDRRALPMLDRILTGKPRLHEQEDLIVQALHAYVEIDRKGGVERMIKALRHESDTVRAIATIRLGQLKVIEAIDELSERLDDPVPWIRREAVMTLVSMHDPRVIELILVHAGAWLHESDIGGESNGPQEPVLSLDAIMAIESLPLSPEQRERWKAIKNDGRAR